MKFKEIMKTILIFVLICVLMCVFIGVIITILYLSGVPMAVSVIIALFTNAGITFLITGLYRLYEVDK